MFSIKNITLKKIKIFWDNFEKRLILHKKSFHKCKTNLNMCTVYKLNNAEINIDDSIITTKEDTIYYHDNLQIQSKPGGFDPTTGKVIKSPYYLEMRDRYTMCELLEYFYDKLNIPVEFRDNKRDEGAMNHLITTYKSFTLITPVDFILYMIDYSASNKIRINNPLDLKNVAQQTYELLEVMIPCTKLELRRREENVLCSK
jgi:hypothetical protein